jgi:flagellin
MSVVINTNSAATIASNNLSASNAMLQRSLNRLSSGSKIVNASDDAGGVAVAGRLSASSKRVGVITQNIGNAVSYLQHQDSALKTVSKMLERMSELQSLYGDATKQTAEKNLYVTEFEKLSVAIEDIELNTDFNGTDVFGAKTVKVNDDASGTFAIDANALTTVTAAASSGVAAAITVDVKADIATVAGLRATNGAMQSVLGYYTELNSSAKATFESAISKIVDVDVAEESTQLARWNTLVQAGTAMVAQANGTTQGVLTLLRG